MRRAFLMSAFSFLVVLAGCDLFPAEPPTAQVRDAGVDGSAGASGSAGAGGFALDSGPDASDGGAGQGGIGGDSGTGGVGGMGGGGAAGEGGGPVTVTVLVADGVDDVNEDGPDFEPSRPSVWLGTGDHKNASYVGFRFVDVPVPVGATIDSARLIMYVPLEEAAGIELRFGGEASDDCAPLSSGSGPSSRTATNALIDYVPNETWLAETSIELDGLGAIVSEVVDRPGWQSGNAICLTAKGVGSAQERRYVASFDGDPALAPQLEIVYSVP